MFPVRTKATITIYRATLAKLKELAIADKRSLSNYISIILDAWIKAKEEGTK